MNRRNREIEICDSHSTHTVLHSVAVSHRTMYTINARRYCYWAHIFTNSFTWPPKKENEKEKCHQTGYQRYTPLAIRYKYISLRRFCWSQTSYIFKIEISYFNGHHIYMEIVRQKKKGICLPLPFSCLVSFVVWSFYVNFLSRATECEYECEKHRLQSEHFCYLPIRICSVFAFTFLHIEKSLCLTIETSIFTWRMRNEWTPTHARTFSSFFFVLKFLSQSNTHHPFTAIVLLC